MAEFIHKDIGITGIACTVPQNRIDIKEYYCKFGQKTVDAFMEKTGVKGFHRAVEEQTASDLCYLSAKRIIECKNIDREEIGAIVFVSQTPDYVSPATAHVLHERLGLSQKCIAFDINLGCSGWVFGINVCASLMETSNITKALVCFGDTSSKTISPEDGAQIMLMGEAGSATLLERKDGEIIHSELMSDGTGYKAIIIPSGAFRNRKGSHERTMWPVDGYVRSDFDSYMNGMDVFGFAITRVPRTVKNYLRNSRLSLDVFDSVVLHQANLLILQQIAKKLKISFEKIPISLERYGNTSGTSVPLTICDKYGSSDENRNVRLLGCGFGVGLSWGIIDFRINKQDIFTIDESDEFYRMGGLSHE